MSSVCVPSINTCLRLDGITDVVKGFIEKGYKLADKFLNPNYDETIDNIEFILGANAIYCLPKKTKIFGRNILSVYSDTLLGIMLMGDVRNIINNLPFLPDAECVCSTTGSTTSVTGREATGVMCCCCGWLRCSV